MARKITVIGAGSVGATIAYRLSLGDVAGELVLIDVNKKKAVGEVMDITQGLCFKDPMKIVAGEYEDAKDSDIVVITSGIGRKPGQSRLDLVKTNVGILKDITPQIVSVCPNALYVIVANPVDIMTYVFCKISGIPETHVIGSGTSLDSARLRCGISEKLGVSQKNIHAYVFGEHGDSSFIPWSCANVSGVPLDDYVEFLKEKGKDVDYIDKDDMLEYVQKSGGKIIANKGATFYAVAVTTVHICKLISGAGDSVSTVSTMMHGEYGVDDVCVSAQCLIGPDGVKGVIPVPLTNQEVKKMQISAKTLKDIIAQLDFEEVKPQVLEAAPAQY